MKLNLDIIRAILLQIESQPRGFIGEQISVNGYSNDEVVYHLVLMMDKGLIEGVIRPLSGLHTPLVLVNRMTWTGHDFLDACRDEGRWVEAKKIFSKLDGVTFDVAKGVLVRLMTTAATQLITGGAL